MKNQKLGFISIALLILVCCRSNKETVFPSLVFKVKVDNELIENERKRIVFDSIISSAVESYPQKENVRHLTFYSLNFQVEENQDTTFIRITSKVYLKYNPQPDSSRIVVESVRLYHAELTTKEIVKFEFWNRDLQLFKANRFLKIYYKESSILFQKKHKYFEMVSGG